MAEGLKSLAGAHNDISEEAATHRSTLNLLAHTCMSQQEALKNRTHARVRCRFERATFTLKTNNHIYYRGSHPTRTLSIGCDDRCDRPVIQLGFPSHPIFSPKETGISGECLVGQESQLDCLRPLLGETFIIPFQFGTAVLPLSTRWRQRPADSGCACVQ